MGFKYSASEVQDLMAMVPGYTEPHWFILALEGACDEFLDRVLFHRPLAGAEAAGKADAARKVLEFLPLAQEVEQGLDALFWELVRAGTPPEKGLAQAALRGDIDWYDFRRFIARREIRGELEQLEVGSPDDAERNFKGPRNELFLDVFRIWATVNSTTVEACPLSDSETCLAQDFIRKASERACMESGRFRDFASRKTIYRTIREARQNLP